MTFIPHRISSLLSPAAASGMLALVLLGGCANEKALLTQTQPLQDRIDRVEQNLATTSEAGLRTAETRAQELARQQTELARQLAEAKVGLDKLADQVKVNESRLLQSVARLDEKDALLDTRLGGLENRLDQTTAKVHNTLRDIADLQARQSQNTATDNALADQLSSLERRLSDAALRIKEADASAREAANRSSVLQSRQETAEQSARQNADSIDQRLRSAERKLDTVASLVEEALALAAKEIFLANGKEAFTVLLTDDKVLYPQNDPNLDARDASKLKQLASDLGKLDQEYHLDIQGHTANNSTDDNNYSLGKARAEVVKRHLHEKQGISLSRMSTISYGANKPAIDGQIRRIFIRVLVLK